jgi:CheY-like chemotaxis protein
MGNSALTILHVEDDPVLVKLVQVSFEGFGFHGNMLTAGRVDEALELLDARARNHEPISLILVDMQLPDGTGLDVIREIKSDPVWQMVPVIALSNEAADEMVTGAYVLGANCYLPKIPKVKSSITSLQAIYKCWLEASLLPKRPRRDRLQEAISRAMGLRARTSDFYLGLARAFEREPDEMWFWLDRSLNAGNLSNLLAFFRNRLGEGDVPHDTAERLFFTQTRVRKALATAESRLRRNPAPGAEEACRWVLDLVGVMDEELFAELLGCLFPKGPVATVALKARAATQLKELANHMLERVTDTGLRQRARALLDWGERLAGEMKTG